MRIVHLWNAIDDESEAIKIARYNQVTYEPFVFFNRDTKKQFLTISRYLHIELSQIGN